MKLNCKQWCHIKEMLANLKCPNCFNVKVALCDDDEKDNAKCEKCGCRFEFNPEVEAIGME